MEAAAPDNRPAAPTKKGLFRAKKTLQAGGIPINFSAFDMDQWPGMQGQS
jgi:hypothetical protein